MPPPRAPLTTAQSRLLAAVLEQVQGWVAATPLVTRVAKATVTSVAAGGAADGSTLAVISWRGTDVPAPYVASYTPTAGHVVAVARTGSQLLILGRIIGTP